MLCGKATAQNEQHFTFLNGEKKAIIGANISLKNQKDTTQIIYLHSDTLGSILAKISSNSSYLLRATSIEYSTFIAVIKFQKEPFVFFMKEQNKELNEIVIRAKKPLIEQEDDKMIVDAEQLAVSSINGFDVLKKTPSILVDNNGNVYLSGTSAATIYINGREQKMSSADLASMLKSLPARAIQKIEIIRIPSAKYDASNAGGAVNIILKKGLKIGTTGSFDLCLSQGRYGDQTFGLSLNNNTDSRSTYFSLNHGISKGYDYISNTRTLPESSFLLNSNTINTGHSTYLGYGIGIELNKNLTLNYDGNLSFRPNKSTTDNDNSQYDTQRQSLFHSIDNITKNNGDYSINQSVSSNLKLDSLGSELTSDFSYRHLTGSSNQNYQSFFDIPKISILRYDNDLNTQNDLFIGKIDFKFKTINKLTIESGIKATYQNFKSNTLFFDNKEAQDVINLQNNNYTYRENLFAGYAMLSKTIRKFGIKGGFRVENTNMAGHQIVPKDTLFDISRTDLFPYFHLSYPVFKIKGIELKAFLIARRSITRPSYDLLNPSVQPLSQFLYQTGNPSLKPQFTQNYEANITVANYPLLAIGQRNSSDIFGSVVYQDAKNQNVTYKTYDNLGTNKETYIRLILGIPPGEKYFFFLGGQFSNNQYQGLYENKPLTYNRSSWFLFNYHQYNLDNLTTITLYGHLILKGQKDLVEFSNIGDVHFDINRYFLDRKLQVSLYVNDIFYTNPYSYSLNQGSINATGYQSTDSRRVGVSFKYSFGINRNNNVRKNKDSDGKENNMFDIGKLKN